MGGSVSSNTKDKNQKVQSQSEYKSESESESEPEILVEKMVLCLEEQCGQGMDCKKCLAGDGRKKGHKYVMIEEFLDNDEVEIKQMLGGNYK